MYKLTRTGSVIRVLDALIIPNNQENSDFCEYEAWLSEGNEPLPPDQPIIDRASSIERAWRDSELLKADVEVNKAVDSAHQSESAWRQYRVALRYWPQSPEFPDSSARPAAPQCSDLANRP